MQNELAELISATLAEFRSGADDEMQTFAMDCHPWNGFLALAFLTRAELKDAPFLSEVAEMAAWKYYDFGARLASWRSASGIGLRMRALYEKTENTRSKVAIQCLQTCASAVASKQVQDVLSTFRLAEGFRITVPHPDMREEFYQ